MTSQLVTPPDTNGPEGGWFHQLGHPVATDRANAAVDLLAEHGHNPAEAALVISVVAREIHHDNPDAAQQYIRSFVNKDETLVMMTCATLCSTDNLPAAVGHPCS